MSVILATAGYDHKIRFWEAPSGICSRIIKYPDSQVNRLQITPDKQFIAAAGNPHIRLYEILNSTPPVMDTANNNQHSNSTHNHPQEQQQHHHGDPHHPQHNNNDEPTTAGGVPNGEQQQQPVLTLEGHTSAVTSIGFQKDGRYLYSGSEDGTIKVWDLRNPNYSRSFDSKAPVNSVTLRTDRDEFISGDQNGTIKIWDLRGDGCIHSLKPGASVGSGVNNNDCASNNSRPNSRSRSGSHVGGDVASKTAPTPPLQTGNSSLYDEGTVPIQAVDISEDSHTLVAISNHGIVYVWGTEKNETLDRHHHQQQNDNDNINTTPTLHSHDAAAGGGHLLSPLRKFRAHALGGYGLHCKIAPDCRHLVTTGSDGLANLWDTTTWELSQSLRNSKCWVWDAAFCADSSYLVTASSDHIARLWNLRTGDVVRQYHGHQSAVTCVALNDSSV